MATSTISPYLLGLYNGTVTLSGGNLIATKSVSSGQSPCLCTPILKPGKWYWEQTANNIAGGAPNMVGFTLYYYTSFSNYLGQDTISVGYGSGGSVYINGSTTTIQTYATGQKVSVAVDTAAGLCWFRTNGGNWNNAAIGVSNPATGIGGITISSGLIGLAICPAIGLYTVGDVTTINLGGSAFTYTAPTGFSAPSTWATPSGVAGETKSEQATQFSVSGVATATAETGSFFSYKLWSPAGVSTSISGTVKENTTAVAKTVFLYDNVTGAFIGGTISTGGNFSIPALGHTQVFAVAFDPATFQAIVYDQLTPV